MAKRPGEQSEQSMNREVKPNAGCDIPGRQYSQNPYEKDGGTAYWDVDFDRFNNVIPEKAPFEHQEATPGQGSFNDGRIFDYQSEQELANGYRTISLEDQHSGGSQNRASTYFVGPDQSPDGRYGDDRAPVVWPGSRPQTNMDFNGDGLQRGDVTNRSFRKGK